MTANSQPMKPHALYVHTDEAIKFINRPDRKPENKVFLSISVEEGEICKAWKCEITKNGIIHPAYKTALSIEDILNWEGFKYPGLGSPHSTYIGRKGCYVEISIEELKTRISSLK